MKVITSSHTSIILNFERGEELYKSLLSFCIEESIAGATFTGLGAADEIELAYYHLPTKKYEREQIRKEVEILSLTGNLGILGSEKMLHIHGVFGRRDLSTFGGHIFSLRVSGACEIHLHTLPTPLSREYDEITGLNLLCSAM